jgi:PAS domain S-box-containing protein
VLRGRTAADVLPRFYFARVLEHYEGALAGRESTLELPSIEGTAVYGSAFAPVRAGADEVTGIVIFSHEIAQPRRAPAPGGAPLLSSPQHQALKRLAGPHRTGVSAAGVHHAQRSAVNCYLVFLRRFGAAVAAFDERAARQVEPQSWLAQQDEFWHVFAHSRAAMLLVTDDGVYTEVNDAACRLFRLPRQNLVGRRSDEFVPDDLQDRVPELRRELHTRGHLALPWSLSLPDGSLAAVHVTATAHVLPERHLAVFFSAGQAGRGGPRLSPREREVTLLLARGMNGADVARQLVLSPETVRTHIRNAMQHTGARTRVELVAIAVRAGLIEP